MTRRFIANTWLLLAACIWGIPTCTQAAAEDILLDIVQHCVSTQTAGYCESCRSPQLSQACPGKSSCKTTTEVWSENEEFVAIRDIKMCDCPDGFVHGLVIPKRVITGIEDDKRPDSIWPFAWEVALQRIPIDELALAVNSKSKRTQNQLHVHLVRLKTNALPKLTASVVGQTNDVSQIWQLASVHAQKRHLKEYGVLVFAAPRGGVLIAITDESPEGQFTQAFCHS